MSIPLSDFTVCAFMLLCLAVVATFLSGIWVSALRQGIDPQESVRRVIERILRRNPAMRTQFVGFVALRADGAVGYGATTPGFKAAVWAGDQHELRDAPVM